VSVSSGISNSERERLQAMYAEIATLAGGLAHEIRNPLSTIGMNLELLAEDIDEESSPNTHRMKAKIQTVQRECRHLEEILNQFLQFAAAGELDLVESDLNTLVQDFIVFYQPQAADKSIDISPHLDADLPPVAIDQLLLRQVLMNLVQNAEQAMPGGGLLEFQTLFRNGRVELELIDNGSGMEERTVSKIFQAFFSTRSGGSGLGLPTVKKIVESHLGTISCESEPGRGTRFTISFPPATIARDAAKDGA
jgi:two-component system sensor histidine kinase HydH